MAVESINKNKTKPEERGACPPRPQAQQAKRQRSAAIADSRRLTKALEGCSLCITSARRPKHLTLAIGQASYLMLPARCPTPPRPPQSNPTQPEPLARTTSHTLCSYVCSGASTL